METAVELIRVYTIPTKFWKSKQQIEKNLILVPVMQESSIPKLIKEKCTNPMLQGACCNSEKTNMFSAQKQQQIGGWPESSEGKSY